MPEQFRQIVIDHWDKISSLLYTPISNKLFITLKDKTTVEIGIHSAVIDYPNGDKTACILSDLKEKI